MAYPGSSHTITEDEIKWVKQHVFKRRSPFMKKKILNFVANNFEDLELLYPKYRMQEAGAKVVVAGAKAKEEYKSKHGYPCKSDIAFSKVNVKDYDALIIPGGYAPDALTIIPWVLEITRIFHKDGKLVAFICHAGWVPPPQGY